jgi:eukaryotic-like serine/threonine-protein kinase
LTLLDKFFGPEGYAGPFLGQVAGCKLLEMIADGPMSTIYLARDPAGKPIAAKILSAHGCRIAEKLSVRLGKPWEGERARALNHTNVVRTFVCGREKGTYYILMEYLVGGSFAEHLRLRTPEIMARRLDILIGAANGLAYVHEKGIIHRDICPKNLMFDSQGTVKLIDFGVAVHKFDRLKETETRTGRPSYLAPELIRHNHYNAQTDIYAFGVMLYEAFAGQRPFLSDDREELMNLQMRASPLPPTKIVPTLPAVVDAAVLRALEKVPQQRYASMREVGAALVRLKMAWK